MIIVNIIGGLGNQMFQYAAARALSVTRGADLLLDVSGFKGYGLHNGFELMRIFNTSCSVASIEDVRSIIGWRSPKCIRRILTKSPFSMLRSRRFVVEPCFKYWSGIKGVSTHCYLVGYWQSARYFSDVAQTIRDDFTFKLPLSGKNIEIAEKIAASNSVSLHVRRGDYINNPKTFANHGVCSLDYYQAAVCHVAKRLVKPHFYVFSDDMEWVKQNIKMEFPCSYIDHNLGSESYNDMRLMSLCKHNIIANSSFSWWGAWLNSNADKIVVAPKKWFANETRVDDLMPDGWIAL